jgi:hypothetical protein
MPKQALLLYPSNEELPEIGKQLCQYLSEHNFIIHMLPEHHRGFYESMIWVGKQCDLIFCFFKPEYAGACWLHILLDEFSKTGGMYQNSPVKFGIDYAGFEIRDSYQQYCMFELNENSIQEIEQIMGTQKQRYASCSKLSIKLLDMSQRELLYRLLLSWAKGKIFAKSRFEYDLPPTAFKKHIGYLRDLKENKKIDHYLLGKGTESLLENIARFYRWPNDIEFCLKNEVSIDELKKIDRIFKTGLSQSYSYSFFEDDFDY